MKTPYLKVNFSVNNTHFDVKKTNFEDLEKKGKGQIAKEDLN